MIDPGNLVVLDMAVLVYLARDGSVGQRIRKEHELGIRPDRPLISIITVGEIRSLVRQWGWGRRRSDAVDELLRQVVIVRVAQGDITRRYAEVDHHNRKVEKPARPIGQNDTWIAATATAVQGTLITSDADYDHLAPRFFHLVRVDAKTGETILTVP